jgi:hypothetical protein
MTNIEYIAVHSKVLIVAVHRVEGTWKAYVTPVAGINHRYEAPISWQSEGEQMGESQARAFFPHLKDKPYAR